MKVLYLERQDIKFLNKYISIKFLGGSGKYLLSSLLVVMEWVKTNRLNLNLVEMLVLLMGLYSVWENAACTGSACTISENANSQPGDDTAPSAATWIPRRRG